MDGSLFGGGAGRGSYNDYFNTGGGGGGGGMLTQQELDRYLTQTQMATSRTRNGPGAPINGTAAGGQKQGFNLYLIGTIAVVILLALGGGFYLWKTKGVKNEDETDEENANSSSKKEKKKKSDDSDNEERQVKKHKSSRSHRRDNNNGDSGKSKSRQVENEERNSPTPKGDRKSEETPMSTDMLRVKHFVNAAVKNLKFAESELQAWRDNGTKNKMPPTARENIIAHCSRAQAFMQCANSMCTPSNMRDFTGAAPEDVYERVKKVKEALDDKP